MGTIAIGAIILLVGSVFALMAYPTMRDYKTTAG